MRNMFGGMYLRPGNLWKTFSINRLTVSNMNGKLSEKVEDTGMEITGILAQADTNIAERHKHLWDQDKHQLTHTLVVRGKMDLRKGDYLTREDKIYLVLLNDDIGDLGTAGLIYLEERNDLS